MNKAFTLIELLIVIAILAILATVITLAINPIEYFKQTRDAKRMAELNALNQALQIYDASNVNIISQQSSTTVYVSIADPNITGNSTSSCSNMGLPSLPSNYSYYCVSQANLRKTDGTGWIPVNFQSLSSGSPLSALPIDPINTTSSGNYYTYTQGGSWELTTIFESQKYIDKAAQDGGPDSAMYEIGTNLSLSPFVHGLLGYWQLDENSGTIASDLSGNGHNGTWNGSGNHFATGKVGLFAGQFNGSDDYVSINTWPSSSHEPLTIGGWFNVLGGGNYMAGLVDKNARFSLFSNAANGAIEVFAGGAISCGYDELWANSKMLVGSGWHFIYATIDSANKVSIYYDGILDSSKFFCGVPEGSNLMNLGLNPNGNRYFNGQIDDVRIYNRALSAAEIAAIYNAEK